MPKKDRHGWKTTKSELKYKNPWISVREDAVIYPDGRAGIYGVVEKGPGVAIVPVDADGGIYLLRQYRYTLDREIWELPAGAMHEGEAELAACARELAEELAMAAGRYEKLGSFFTAPGHENAEILAYLATELSPVPHLKQHDESILEIRKFSRAEIEGLVARQELHCGITLAALACWRLKAS
jgi:8-oxo-dGTP pyrophosphatase MutT (NUDIX family)